MITKRTLRFDSRPSIQQRAAMLAIGAALAASVGAAIGCGGSFTTRGDGHPTSQVDETGYLQAELMQYTAEDPLVVGGLQRVQVVGLPNSITQPGGELHVRHISPDARGDDPNSGDQTRDPWSADEPRAGGKGATDTDTDTDDLPRIVVDSESGSFWAVLPATLGDTLIIAYELDGHTDEIHLSIDAALEPVNHDHETVTVEQIWTILIPHPDDPSRVDVDTSRLATALIPPFVIYNSTRGNSALQSEVAVAPIGFAARAGDRVCLFQLATDARPATTAHCETVPQ